MSTLKKENGSISIISDSIVNSLGYDTEQVFFNMQSGISGSKLLTNYTLSEPTAMLSLIDKSEFYAKFSAKFSETVNKSFTFFEKIMIYSIQCAIEKCTFEIDQKDVLFIFSTTKGNIGLLDKKFEHTFEKERVSIWKSASLITQFFNNPNRSIIISNACISGTQALIVAKNMLPYTNYKYIIVCGADVVTPFIVSGFQSFKALSPDMCKPFDKNRIGLNIGEGVGTIILKNVEGDYVSLDNGAVTNDANHISGPSRNGEGLYRALQQVLKGIDLNDISFINAHGTATPYNDEMEAIAFHRAQLSNTPINSFKAHFGHTLGAAGIIESIISAKCLQNGIVLPSFGYEENGVSVDVNISEVITQCKRTYCVKTASGFGGCNGVLLLKKGGNRL